MVNGEHYAGMGSMSCNKGTKIFGPILVVVNEETNEISARIKAAYVGYSGYPNYGFSSVFTYSVEGTITGKTVIEFPGGTVTYYHFSFSEHYHEYTNRGEGTGFFLIDEVFDYISVGLLEN